MEESEEPVMCLAVFTTLCSAFRSETETAVEVHQNQETDVMSPQEEEKLVRLLDQDGDVRGPREVLGDVDTQKLEAGYKLNLCPVGKISSTDWESWESLPYCMYFNLDNKHT